MGVVSWRWLSATSVAGVMVPSRWRCSSALGRRRMKDRMSSIYRVYRSNVERKIRTQEDVRTLDMQIQAVRVEGGVKKQVLRSAYPAFAVRPRGPKLLRLTLLM